MLYLYDISETKSTGKMHNLETTETTCFTNIIFAIANRAKRWYL